MGIILEPDSILKSCILQTCWFQWGFRRTEDTKHTIFIAGLGRLDFSFYETFSGYSLNSHVCKGQIWVNELEFTVYVFFSIFLHLSSQYRFFFKLTVDAQLGICKLLGNTKQAKSEYNSSLWLKMKAKKKKRNNRKKKVWNWYLSQKKKKKSL